ncbi:General stress protein 17O [Granulibacter bethesdensis CGDNIH1]|uniref:General stress protein 17O n=2 Tax=Granulibacter bethesdensis TaxID=364410 RepID=Q0BUW9_GRABC|nr:General stress protein 17O [Granulibacter bethesdensis CGDNIH1]APH51175.1 General stress protein 17O [Granulibacter bethesdensis]APH63869.1 General stress protein 17O [Granulibacter bethesdensis]
MISLHCQSMCRSRRKRLDRYAVPYWARCFLMSHSYLSRIVWTGNRGCGTSGYRDYDRSWDIAVPGKPVIHCSNDPLLGGDTTRMNPEDLLLSALAACHMLWYLHYASESGIVVTSYEDQTVGIAEVAAGGAGQFVSATLHPRITVHAQADLAVAEAIHHRIHEVCLIARSVKFPVYCAPEFISG